MELIKRVMELARDLTIVVGLLAVAIFGSYTYFSQETGPAMLVRSLSLENPAINYGENLTFVTDLTILRSCEVTIHRSITDLKSKAIVWRGESPSPITKLGTYSGVKTILVLPMSVPPGDYLYESTWYPVCLGKPAPVGHSPQVPFKIVY